MSSARERACTLESVTLEGYLEGHNNWVTCMKMGEEEVSKDTYKEFLISGSRDRSLIIWDLAQAEQTDEKMMGHLGRVLKGRFHLISDFDQT